MKVKNIVAAMLAAVMMFSSMTVSFAAVDAEGHGGSGGSGGGTAKGTFSTSLSGYRIYIYDSKTGEVVSNVIDFVRTANGGTNELKAAEAHLETKLGVPSAYKRIPQEKIEGTTSEWPLPMVYTSTFVGNGDSVKSWMLNGEGNIGSYVAPSWGGSDYKDGTSGVPLTPSKQEPVTPDNSMYDLLERLAGYDIGTKVDYYYNLGIFTSSDAQSAIQGEIASLVSAIKSSYSGNNAALIEKTLNVAYSNKVSALKSNIAARTWPTRDQIRLYQGLYNLTVDMQDGKIEDKSKYRAYSPISTSLSDSDFYTSFYNVILPSLTGRQQTNINNKKTTLRVSAKNAVDSWFNISYAAVDKSTGNGNLFVILNYKMNGDYIFRFTNGTVAKSEEAATGSGKNDDAITYTCYTNEYDIGIEPVFWFRPATAGCASTYSSWFYGTPTNYGKWQVEQASKAGGWTDGGKGGHYLNAINKIGAACMILKDSEDALSFEGGKHVDTVNVPSSSLTNSTLGNSSLGYAMHWYTFAGKGGVPTYDKGIGDTPHPAPDPTKPDPGDGSYNINIVKVYDYQHEDGSVEHVTTTYKTNEPGMIHIEHEPTYKVIAYFTSNTLHSNARSESLTWEDVNTMPVISGSEYSWSTVKGKPAGSAANTVYIGKYAETASAESMATTLYVRLLKTDVATQVEYGANIISESQLNRAIGTDKKFGEDATQSSNWGSYIFNCKLEPIGDHTYSVRHSYTDSNGKSHSYTTYHTCHREYVGDAVFTYSVGQTPTSVETQSKSGAASVFKPIVVTSSGTGSTATTKIAAAGGFNWDNGPEYHNDDGVAQFTTIWRGCVDTVTLAKYKQSDMSGYSNLATLFGSANSNPAKRATGAEYSRPITLTLNGTPSSVVISHSYSGHGSGTATPTMTPDTIDFTGSVKIFCYAGVSHGLSSTDIGAIQGVTSGRFLINSFNKKCETTLKFNPYIRMSFQYTQDGYDTTSYNTEGAKLFKPLAQPGNTFNGALGTYLKDRTAYVLSDKQSSILPTNAIEVGWYNPTQTSGKYGLQMTSQQWSIHNRATNGSEWRKPNQVLPGGAMYQLNTTGTETTLRAITYSAMVNPTDTWIDGATANEYSAAQVTKNNNEFIEQYRDIVENYKVVQWVNKDWSLNMPWDNNNAVKIERGGESLSKLGLSTKASTDSKYLLFAGNSGNGASEGDIDILSESYVVTMYKIFTDSEGNVYFAKQQSSPSKTPATEDTFSGLMTQLANTNGTNPTGAILLGTRTQNVDQVMASIQTSNNEVYQVDQKTGAVRNVLNAISRNRGNDENAAWVTDNKWYNEAFDGYYVAMQTMTYKVGFKDPSRRVSVLDPNLCPAKSSTSNIFTNAHVSAFRLNDKSDSAKASGKGSGYMGTFFGIDAFMPDVENMFYTRPFYIPNANVQDLT